MAILSFDIHHILQLDDTVDSETLITLTFYGTLEDADVYFDNRLRSGAWQRATFQQRKAALAEASESIDRLNFVGYQSANYQRLQFPRNGDTIVPINIVKACYEIALKLLEGFDIDMEVRGLTSKSQGFSTVRNIHDRSFIPQHIRAGIISIKAWDWLKPYLVDSNERPIIRLS
jgi:hypothetical protein